MDREMHHVVQPHLLVPVEDLEGLGHRRPVDDARRVGRVAGRRAGREPRQGDFHLRRQLRGRLEVAADLVEAANAKKISRYYCSTSRPVPHTVPSKVPAVYSDS